MTELDVRTRADLWVTPQDITEDYQGAPVDLEVERDDGDRISLHTFVNGEGSIVTYELTREGAIELATKLLLEARLR